MGKKAKKASKKKEQKTHKERVKDFKVEISQTASDVKTFIKKFRSDIDKKKKMYQLYAKKVQKKKL